jgi:hypothetical protein
MTDYTINEKFQSLPLDFDPYTSLSTYRMQNTQITVHDGFIKGLQKNSDGSQSLVIRAIAPLPGIMLSGNTDSSVSLQIENINPDFYAESVSSSNLTVTKITPNTIQINIELKAGSDVNIVPEQPNDPQNAGKYNYVILGDNRDGYDTFEQIIQQVNGFRPVFVIDNGDLVFSGKPNQYRLFDQMTAQLSTTLCTTLGNHDIRGDGAETYRMLYGPSFYSFDFADSHFVFLDSSPGWAHKQAISEEQYTWLEQDLQKAQGRHIFVITHIPPHDPRSGVTPNEIPNYIDKAESGDNWADRKLSNYYETKDMAHGFQDPAEADKFESIMSTYHVETVYLSHIHSYYEYTKDDVRYLISGGAGAELLTANSYYHYMIARTGGMNNITMVELPSPANQYLARYAATAQLFTSAMFKENPASVVLVIVGAILFVLWIIVRMYFRRKKFIDTFGKWLFQVLKYAGKTFKEYFGKKKDK